MLDQLPATWIEQLGWPEQVSEKRANFDTIKKIKKQTKLIGEADKYGRTPLLLAVYHDNVELLEFLLETDASVINARDKVGDTALHYAARYAETYGHENTSDVASLLIEKKANVSAENNIKETPLHQASSKAIVNLLIEKGADVNAKDDKGYTPIQASLLHHADKGVLEQFIAKGYNTNGLYEFIVKTTSHDIREREDRMLDYEEVWERFEKTRLDLSDIAKDANKKGAWSRILC